MVQNMVSITVEVKSSTSDAYLHTEHFMTVIVVIVSTLPTTISQLMLRIWLFCS